MIKSPPRCLRFAGAVVLLAVALLTSGCGAIARRIASELAVRRIERQFTVIGGRATAFRSCLSTSGGACAAVNAFGGPTAAFATVPLETDLGGSPAGGFTDTTNATTASAAQRALQHPVQLRLNALYNTLSRIPAPGTDGIAVAASPEQGEAITLDFSTAEIEEYTRLIAEATEADDWNVLAGQAAAMNDPNSWSSVLSSYLATYVSAYFRGGKFFKVDLSSSGVMAALRARFPSVKDDELQRLFPELLENLPPWSFGSIGATGFVTRSGAVYRFPAIDVQVDPSASRAVRATDLKLPLVAADLTRVVLEAVFDAHDRLPAVSGATGLGIAGAPLPLHDPATSPVDADDFANVDRLSNQAEAAVSSAVGPAIRGAGWASLNNDALATLIETLVSVTVRKVTEKATWCWYSCQLDNSAALVQPGERVQLNLVVTAQGDS